jgi:CubicO group peptidase (beta-lactamase class C family)
MQYSKIVADQIEQGIIRGAVIMAGRETNVDFCEAFGEARDGIEMQVDSIFDIASITKPLATASACVLCLDRGLLDFNSSVIHYLPECHSKISDSVTVRQLATHTSGIAYSPFTDKTEAAEEIFNTLSQDYEPDSLWRYSCLEYILLGLIVERVTGERLDQFCRDNIFTPLKMNDTAWGPITCTEKVTEPLTVAPGQISDFNAYLMSIKKRAIGNAGVFSTASDLAIVCNALMNPENTIFSQSNLAQLTTNCVPISTIPPHSFGWNMDPLFQPNWMSKATFYHSGWTGNTVWIDPENKSWFIILAARHGDYDKAKQGRLAIANSFSMTDKITPCNSVLK